ncbi:major facilitator superfamily domain-containing protein [Aspergillus spectabilis]
MRFWDTVRFGGGGQSAQDVEQAASEANPKNQAVPVVEIRPHTDALYDQRVAFLDTFTPQEQKKIICKVDRRILVIIGVIYLVKQNAASSYLYIGANNAASVKVLAVDKPTNFMTQLKMTADQYNWVQSYIIFELPSNLFLKWMSPRVGSRCHAAVQNKEGLYPARFFLGLAEAGLFPSIITHLCNWYRSEEMGKPIMWLFGIFNLAGVLGSLLGLSSWQWVFLIEGVATMAFAGLIWVVYPDYPRSPCTEQWLAPREQEFIELRLTENAPKTHDESFSWAEVVDTLKKLADVVVHAGSGVYEYRWIWADLVLPTITTNLGFAGLPRNQLLNIPPAAAGIIAIIVTAWLLKKAFIPRPLLALIIVACEVVSFSIFLASQAWGAVYAACVLGSMAIAMGLQSGVSQLGGVIGPRIFRSKFAADGYRTSYAICVGALGGCLLFNCLSWFLTRNLEWDVHRIRRRQIKAEKEERLFTEDEVKFFNERQVYQRAEEGCWR